MEIQAIPAHATVCKHSLNHAYVHFYPPPSPVTGKILLKARGVFFKALLLAKPSGRGVIIGQARSPEKGRDHMYLDIDK